MAKTWTEIKAKIKRELDLDNETIISDTELLEYCNEAIDQAESHIHNLYEDYFLTTTTLSLVSGTSLYSLPTDIYANKIRRIIYDDGTVYYDIKMIHDLSKIPLIDSNDNYQYLLLNSSTSGVQIKLYPAAYETASDHVTIYYIRNAKTLSSGSDTCDIPEFVSYIYAYMIYKCLIKEDMETTQRVVEAKLELDRQEKIMINTLSTRVDDEDNFVQPSTEHYEAHV
jgi:hypothetical protein